MNKTVLRITAVFLCIALLSTVCVAVGGKGDVPAAAAKEETVYVFTDASGSVKNILVSDWLTNPDGSDKLSDRSELTDLENVKGDGAFTQGSDGEVVWQADGEDVYYQGTTEKTPPVTMKTEYFLDGVQIAPEELAGKSGRVTIRYSYENNLSAQRTIGEKTETVYVPFAAVTGLLLDNDVFSNVEVTNGKLVNDGDHTAVVGFALPGMNESLGLDKLEDNEITLPDSFEITADAKNFALDTTMTIVTSEIFSKISVDDTKEAADKLRDMLDQLTDAMEALLDGSSKLYDGLEELLEKSGTLVGGVDALYSGAGTLKTGVGALADGSSELASGTQELLGGLNTLSDNSEKLNAGAQQIFNALLSTAATQLRAAGVEVPDLTAENYASVLDGVNAQLDEAAVRQLAYNTAYAQVEPLVRAQEAAFRAAVTAQVQTKVTEQVLAALGMTSGEYQAGVAAGVISAEVQQQVSDAILAAMNSEETQATIDQLTEQAIQAEIDKQMNSEAVQSQITAAVEKAKAGSSTVTALKAQLDQVAEFVGGVADYTAGVDKAAAGAEKLNAGAGTLSAGIGQLAKGASELYDGVGTLKAGSGKLVDGVTELRDGQKQLNDGLKQFKEEGVDKLVNAFGGELENVAERAEAMCELAAEYRSFAGIADETQGTVRFIYRSDAIKAD